MRHLFQRIADHRYSAIGRHLRADHRYSAIGRHLRNSHGNIDLLNDSQLRMLKICCTKWNCLVYEMLYEMLYIRTIRPNLNTQSDSIRLFKFIHLLTIYTRFYYFTFTIILLSLDNDVLETSKRRAMLNIIFRRFLLSNEKKKKEKKHLIL